MKILILVLSTDMPPWGQNIGVIKKTWAATKLPEIDIYFYFGKSNKSNTETDIYFNNVENTFFNIGYQTLEMFEYVKDMEFDYIFRTNASSYVNQEKLLEFLKDKPKNNFYSGIIGNYKNDLLGMDLEYASGCGYFLSKDVFNLILENKQLWKHKDYYDDVSLGELLSTLGVELDRSSLRLDIYSTGLDDLEDVRMDESKILQTRLSTINFNDYYHFRCKQDRDRNGDIIIMDKLYEILNK